jgi:hypothetical protein
MSEYRDRIDSRSQDAATSTLARRTGKIERELRLAAVRAERIEILRKVRHRNLGSETARKIIRELDLLEARYAG